MKVIPYTRLNNSTSSGQINDQLAQIKTFCSSQGYEILTMFNDDTISVEIEKGRNWMKLLDYCQNDHRVNLVICTSKDRISRNESTCIEDILLLKDLGIEVVALNEIDS